MLTNNRIPTHRGEIMLEKLLLVNVQTDNDLVCFDYKKTGFSHCSCGLM